MINFKDYIGKQLNLMITDLFGNKTLIKLTPEKYEYNKDNDLITLYSKYRFIQNKLDNDIMISYLESSDPLWSYSFRNSSTITIKVLNSDEFDQESDLITDSLSEKLEELSYAD